MFGNHNTVTTLAGLISSLTNHDDKSHMTATITTDFTFAVLNERAVHSLGLDHEMSRKGLSTIKLDDEAQGNGTLRTLVSASLPLETQFQVAQAFYDYDKVSEAMADPIGVKNAAGSRIYKDALLIDRRVCAKMAARLVKGMADQDKAQILATAIFSELWNDIGEYKATRDITTFVHPLTLVNQLKDPFTAALTMNAIENSPFAKLRNADKLKKDIQSKGNYYGFAHIVRYFNERCSGFIEDFAILAEETEHAMVGLQMMADATHRVIDLPPSWLQNPVFDRVRTCVNWHELTRPDDESDEPHRWASATQSQLQAIHSGVKAFGSGDVTAQAAVDMSFVSEYKGSVDKAFAILNKFLEFKPARDFRNIFSISQVESLDSNDYVNALRVSYKHKRPEVLEVYSGIGFKGGLNKTQTTASLINPVGKISMPRIDTESIMASWQELLSNMTVEEALNRAELIVGEEPTVEDNAGGMLTILPGTDTILITNMVNRGSETSSLYFDTTVGDGDNKAEMPYLAYMAGAAYATTARFDAGMQVEFTRNAEPGTTMRDMKAMISTHAVLTRNSLTSVNPTDILVISRMPSVEAATIFEVAQPIVDLRPLVGSEFYSDNTDVVRFKIPLLPANKSDRRAALGRDHIPFPYMEYTKTFGSATPEDGIEMTAEELADYAEKNEDKKALVRAPIDLRPFFQSSRELYISSVASYISFENELSEAIDAIKALRSVGVYGDTHANRHMIEIVKSLITPYMRTSPRARDIRGLGANPSTYEQKEFMLYSGLYGFKYAAEQTKVVTSALADDSLQRYKTVSVIDRLIAAVQDLDATSMSRILDGAVAIAAKRAM